MSYVTCPKCKGSNSKNYEKCSCVRNGFPDKGCSVCRGTGKSPCYSCDGKGVVYVGNKP